MKDIYIKTLLYSYPCFSKQIKNIEDKSIKIGLNSSNYKTMETVERMINLFKEKMCYIKLEHIISLVLSRLSPEYINLLKYKYFRNYSSDLVIDFDYTSREYYRKQVRILKYFSRSFDLCNLTNEFFETECLQFNFIRSMLVVTEDHNKNIGNYGKNKKVKL